MEFLGLVLAWLLGGAIELMAVEGVISLARFLLRGPLHLLDQAAASWLFLLSPAYRQQQLALLDAAGGAGRRSMLSQGALSAICGISLAALLLSAVL